MEQQTDSIVQSIQTLLNAMRQPGPYGNDFLGVVQEINDVVDSVVKHSKSVLSKTGLISSAAIVLNDLTLVSDQLDTLGRDMVRETPSKSLKQKMASSSYEIAKYVKELLNLLER